MGYIFKTTRWVKQEVLSCDHPQVEKIWDFGSLSAVPSDDKMRYNVCILLKNGDKKTFTSTDVDVEKAITDAEEFLQSL